MTFTLGDIPNIVTLRYKYKLFFCQGQDGEEEEEEPDIVFSAEPEELEEEEVLDALEVIEEG